VPPRRLAATPHSLPPRAITVQGKFPAAPGGTLPRDPAGRHNRRNRQSRRNRGCRDSGVSGFRPGLSARGGAALVRDFAKTRPAAADAVARNPRPKTRKRRRATPPAETRNPGAGAARLAGRLASATGSLGVSELGRFRKTPRLQNSRERKQRPIARRVHTYASTILDSTPPSIKSFRSYLTRLSVASRSLMYFLYDSRGDNCPFLSKRS